MRIALTITELHPGGAEWCLVNLARHLQAKGHLVKVWQLWPTPPADKRALTDQLDLSGIEWHSGGARFAWDFPRVAFWLRNELRGYSPDVVQAFLFHANLATAFATQGLKCPVFGGVRVRQPQRIRWWLQRLASRKMHKMICVSQDVARHCIKVEGIAPDKVEVIPNGIALPSKIHNVAWNKFGLPPEAPIILFVGRLDRQKGVEELAGHADEILAALPKHQLVIMGDGPLRASLVERKSRLLHTNRVHLVGWQALAVEWMKIAQVLVLPAQYEGMPNVVLEAMAVGIPVVAFDVEGIRELLGRSDEQVVERQNFKALTQAIVRLATDHQLRSTCGDLNAERVRKCFQLDEQLSRYETLYLEAARLQLQCG